MSATAPPRPAAGATAKKGGGGMAAPQPRLATAPAASSPPVPAAMPLSIVELCGRHAGRCGYCKGGAETKRAATKKTSVSFGLSARRLLCQDYQALIDLGWRRSGTYMYRPVNEDTCCPCYTIRLEAARFQPSRSQRQVAARLQRYLLAPDASNGNGHGHGHGNGKPSAAAGQQQAADQHQAAGKKRQRAPHAASDASSVASGASAASGRSQLSPREAALVARLEEQLKGALRAALLAPPLAEVAAAAGVQGKGEDGVAALLSLVRVQRCVGAPHGGTASKKGGGDGAGDFASPVALPLVAALRRRLQQQQAQQGAAGATSVQLPAPRAIAEAVAAQLSPPEVEGGEVRVSVAGNGFINFFLPAASCSSSFSSPARPSKEVRRIPVTVATPTTASSSSSVSLGEASEEAGASGSRGKGRKGKQGEDAAMEAVAVHRRGRKAEGREQLQLPREEAEDEEGEENGMQVACTDDEGPGKPLSLAIAVAGSAGARGKGKGHVVTVETVRPAVTEEVFALYKKYQVAVHGDRPAEVTREGFSRFLVQSPLVCYPPPPPSTSPSGGGGGGKAKEADAEEADYRVPYGSYHQLYRLDGRLIAVGVVDILPSCLSSVYCFYDPDFKQLSLGKLTALWEIHWVRQASRFRPDLRYYYLGFYIHTCPKMRYKGAYEPSELLCPVTLRWTPLADCRAILDRRPYARLAPLAPLAEGEEGAGAVEMDVGGAEEEAAAAVVAESGEQMEGQEAAGAAQGSQEEEDDEDEEEEEDEQEGPYGLHVPLTAAEVSALAQVVMDVGPLSALPARSQQILLPILREFVEHVSPALVPRLLLKLR